MQLDILELEKITQNEVVMFSKAISPLTAACTMSTIFTKSM